MVMPLCCTLAFVVASTFVAARPATNLMGDEWLVSALQPHLNGGSRPFWAPTPICMIGYGSNGIVAAVGTAVEQMLGYVPCDGRSMTHAALVVGSAATV